MATLQISEYESIQTTVQGDIVHIPQTPAIAVHELDYTSGTSTESPVFSKHTRFVRVATDGSTDANLAFGKDGVTASAAHDRLPADTVGFWGIHRSKVDRLAVS